MMKLKEIIKKNKTLMSIYCKCRKKKYEIATYISPELNTAMRYKEVFKKKWEPNNPITLNDKILWLKLNTYNNNLLVKQCADKYRVREYVASLNCAEILNELLGVYENVEDINWSELPNEFVMKVNVGCGYNIVVPDKAQLDVEKAKKKLKKWIREKYYLAFSEMQYKDVKPYVLVEKYLRPERGVLPEDYKFYCMNGRAEYVMICIGRENGGHPRFYFFNRDWEFVPFGEKDDPHIEKPKLIEEAFEYADRLSSQFPFVRVDLYVFDDTIYFGELTFTSAGGLDTEISNEGSLIMGEKIDLKYGTSKKN